MNTAVSHETDFSTRVAMEIQQRLAGRRRNVRHGGKLCSHCLARTPRIVRGKPAGDCSECHKQAQKDYRARQKARNTQNARLADEARKFNLLASKENNLSKGTDNEQDQARPGGDPPG